MAENQHTANRPQTPVGPTEPRDVQTDQPVEQPSETKTQSGLTPQSPTSKKKLLIISLVIFVVILVGVTIIYYIQNNSGSLSQTTPSPNESVGQSVNESPTKWVTYTNTAFNFSIEIPQYDEMPVGNTNNGLIGKKITFYIGENNPLDCKGDCPVINKSSTVSVSGIEVTKIEGHVGTIGGNIAQNYIDYVFPLESGYLTFSLYARGLDDFTPSPDGVWEIESSDIELFDQILSTFEFVE